MENNQSALIDTNQAIVEILFFVCQTRMPKNSKSTSLLYIKDHECNDKIRNQLITQVCKKKLFEI